MFLRKTVSNSNGKRYEYIHLVESYRRKSDGRPVHKVIANLGPFDQVRFDNLKAALEASKSGQRLVVAALRQGCAPPPKPQANLRFLDVAVLAELWDELALSELLRQAFGGDDGVAMPREDVVKALTILRLVEPTSKLGAVRWVPRTALPELLGFDLKHFNNTRVHRVLDELEMAVPALMARLPKLYQQRHGEFTALFMDLSDASFTGQGPELAVRAKNKEGVVRKKVNILLLVNERGFPIRWEVLAGNTSDCRAMSEMAQRLQRHDWVAGVPLVADRAMGHTAQISAMSAMGLRFVTALTRSEFNTYATKLSDYAPSSLEEIEADLDDEELATRAGEYVEQAGMKRVSDTLFVTDLGTVEPFGTEPTAAPVADSDSDSDTLARTLRLAREIALAAEEGRAASQAAAGKARGLKKSSTYLACSLLELAPELQERVLGGELAGCALRPLVRVAKLADRAEQRAAFDELVRIKPSPRLAPGARRVFDSDPSDPSEPKTVPALRVRVAIYFNPVQFVLQRRAALRRREAVDTFVSDLNRKLAAGQSRLTREGLIAAVDRRLRRDHLLNLYTVTVDKRGAHLHVHLVLNGSAWRSQRQRDGFSVIVAHPDLSKTAEELCQLYRAKDTVEKDFQTIKSVVELNPVRHHTDLKVRAHVALCMLALLLERTLRDRLNGRCSPEQALEQLQSCHLNLYGDNDDHQAPTPSLYTVTQPDREQHRLLKALRFTHLADDDHLAARLSPR